MPAITRKLHELQQDKYKKKYEKDLSNASQLQRRLLPEHHLEFHDYELYGACIQHGGDSNVGGDYFDYFLNNTHEEDRLGVLISDAASKGLPAAVQSAFVSGAIKMAQSFSPKISTLLSSINRLVFDTFPFERPVSMCYCELTLSSNRLVLYANAGHVPQIHFRPSTGEFQYLYPTGGLLGILKDQRYVVENVRMLPGDVLCLFSDGITEATDDNGKQFEKERLKSILKENCAGNPETIAHKVIEAVEVFASSEQYNDDRTIIVIKRHENDK
ncbi:MAG: hypothetical protein B7C24_16370 [Bacteroidetes bacterium 4572_77]|nr:MAG: hypothetical protein B7C24_16370 [Bacteroidetes bacterium 4572_77]